jgi:hypothetical protein
VEISYLVRDGQFLEPCTRAIEAQRGLLSSGNTVRIELEPHGYPGRVAVTLKGSDRRHFTADWKSDPTRSPQRIRAAATALRDCGEYGRFEITHGDGLIEIRRVARIGCYRERTSTVPGSGP